MQDIGEAMPSAVAQMPLRKEAPGPSRPTSAWPDSDGPVTSQPTKDCCTRSPSTDSTLEIAWDEFRHSHKEVDPNLTSNLCPESNLFNHSDENHVDVVNTNFGDDLHFLLNRDPFLGQNNVDDSMLVVNPRDVHESFGTRSLTSLEAPVDNDETLLQESFDLVNFVIDDSKSLRHPEFENFIDEPRLFNIVEQDLSPINLPPEEGLLVSGDSADTILLASTLDIKEELPNAAEETPHGLLSDPAPSVPVHNASDELMPRVPTEPTRTPTKRGRPSFRSGDAQPITESEKYRHMRDLNNEASRRCREKRKRREESISRELEVELDRKESLNMQVKELEDRVNFYKSAALKRISPEDYLKLHDKYFGKK